MQQQTPHSDSGLTVQKPSSVQSSSSAVVHSALMQAEGASMLEERSHFIEISTTQQTPQVHPPMSAAVSRVCGCHTTDENGPNVSIFPPRCSMWYYIALISLPSTNFVSQLPLKQEKISFVSCTRRCRKQMRCLSCIVCPFQQQTAQSLYFKIPRCPQNPFL